MSAPLRILNLEDVTSDAELIAHTLRREGFQCIIQRVDTRESFVAALAEFSPDLILSDYSLPSFNGLEALKLALAAVPDVPFIFISGTLGEERAIETLKMGATDYVLKHRLARLAPVVRRALEEARERVIRRQAEDERNKLWAAVETGGDWAVITNLQGTIEYANRAVELISGYERGEILGQNPRLFKSDRQDESYYRDMWQQLLAGEAFRSIIINRKKDNTLFYLDLTITPLRNSQHSITHFVATGKDISEKKLMEERLHYLAYFDVLTGLANRTLFFDRLQQAISITAGTRKVVVAVIDPRRFTYINDTYGVGMGDEMLQEMARRLSESIGPADTVARYGGNCFALILNEVDDIKDALMAIERVENALSRSYQCNSEEVIITFSIGIAVSPTDSTDSKRLMLCAETALIRAKEYKGTSYRFYTADMDIMARNFLAMERDLFHAQAAGEFVLHYQRYFSVRTGQLKGMEALIRWQKPGGELVLPGEFVPVLEETGLVLEVGDWAIMTACQQIATWRSHGFTPVPVSVNLSPTQFRQENLVERIKEHLERAGVEPDLLTIEITENIFVSNVEYTRRIFERFRQLGLRLSIDDFGTGYSSLSYLSRLPLNNLKIDISFIRNITTDPRSFSIVKVIISMAKELGMQTIAEGVETAEQLQLLDQLGCDLVQGYYYSHSIPADEIERTLREDGKRERVMR